MNTQKNHGYLKVDRTGRALVLGSDLRRSLSHQVGFYVLSSSDMEEISFRRVPQIPRHSELREPIVFQGDIGGVGSTIEVINFIASTRLSGQLTCVQDEVRKSLYFKDGDLCAARSNHLDDRLSEVLYRFGALERSEIDRAEAEASSTQRPLGNHLLEIGALNQSQLYLYFKKQVEEIFFSTLLFVHGDFYFTIPHLTEVPSPLSLNAQQILLEGVRRTDEMIRFRSLIPTRETLVVGRDTDGEALTEDLQVILQFLDEPKSMNALVDHFRVGEFQLYQRVFHLIESGSLNVVGEGEDAQQRLQIDDLISLYNNAFQLINGIAVQAGQQDTLNEGLGVFLQFYAFSEVFEGIHHDDRGRLDAARLQSQLEMSDPRKLLNFTSNMLSELLFFQIFATRGWISVEHRTQLFVVYDELSQLDL